MNMHRTLACIAFLAWSALAQAGTVSQFSPQGEVVNVRQVRATFSEAAVGFGDARAAAPFDMTCSEPGSGRWADERNWVFDFDRDVPPGVRCSFTLKPAFRLQSGATVDGAKTFRFQTGGPAVVRIQPRTHHALDEEQVFLLLQNGSASVESLLANAWCEAAGVQERIPVRLVTGPVRDALVKKFEPAAPAERLSALQCVQRLPNEAAVRLVWGKGVSTPGADGVATSKPQYFDYKVRAAFSASFSCARENAQAACGPLSSLRLSLSAPVARALAQKVSLSAGGRNIAPVPDGEAGDEFVSQLSFRAPLPENSMLVLTLPPDFHDDAGRPLANASLFPMRVPTAVYPPLAKFAAAPFGIIELDDAPAMPVTVRNIEADARVLMADGQAAPTVGSLRIEGDAAIMAWMARLNRYHDFSVDIGGKPVETRSIGLLAGEAGVRQVALPAPDGGAKQVRPFEVIGVPLPGPGYYVMELASQRLGAALLGKPAPMYVRTSALVTNLAVHLKVGRENGAVWVTTLDGGKPVAGADVRISDCFGKPLWRGVTGADGVAMVPQQLDVDCGSQRYEERLVQGLFVSARATGRDGRADMAFALSSWNSGIEPFRFNLPTDTALPATVRAHTVFDRTLFRAGQTVSMKHLVRAENGAGLALLPASRLPDRLRIQHQGSGQEYRFPLRWRGGGASDSVFAIPAQARLGRYDVILDSGPVSSAATAAEETDAQSASAMRSGSFRVEEFRLPLLQGRIAPPKAAQVAPSEVPLTLQLNYLNGGGASGLPVTLSALLRERALAFAGYDDFSFAGSADGVGDDRRIVADKLPVKLDRNGIGSTVVRELPALASASEMLSEMHFADPNGEIQTVSQSTPLWPAALVAGIRTGSWVALKKNITLTAVALDLDGKPRAGVPLEITGMLKERSSHRKRMVGGFYAYEESSSSRELGRLCSGKSDARGLLQCEAVFSQTGEVVLSASVTDAAGRRAHAAATVWVGGSDDNWFGAGNQDRIDVLPEKKQYQPGETAVFQVRMPFREATALVAVEREGVLQTSVVTLSGSSPAIRVPVTAAYAPNVYVSVLAVRPRLREVKWYSFFRWGWREPRNWLADFRAYQAPGPTVDLARPAFRFGVAEIGVGTASHQLAVRVSTPQASYPVRGRALATVQVSLPDGRPAAGAEVALAAVDEALLELQPNDSWNLLPAMLQRRGYGVQTATAQLQIVGKRHYGRKALPPGGGGGRASTRELLDTLLLWQPAVVLDADGRAQVEVPLNDALSGFRIVAVATSGAGLYGYGAVSIRTTQDLQLVAGLPPLVRQGDRYSAMATVRNGAERAMDISVSALVDGKPLEAAPRRVRLAAGAAQELAWQVTAPASGDALGWELRAQEDGGANAKDALKVSQKLLPAVPVTVQQATLFQLDKSRTIALAPPAGALPGRGGVTVSLAAGLAGAADGLRRYFSDYPYSCLEQKASRAVGLDDHAGWQKLTAELPSYLDGDGLARYYPSTGGDTPGNPVLSAYLLALAHEAGWSLPEESRERMLRGLQAFVEGRIGAGDDWAPRKDTDVRRLSALEALSRYGKLPPRGLDAINITPGLWPTSALLDWIAILRRTPGLPSHAQRLAEAGQELRARLNFQGSRLGFSSEASDGWFWLMAGADANAVRLMLLAVDDAAWRDDMGRLLTGAIGRQQRGHWNTTTANAWGTLALRKFSAAFEAETPGGATGVVLRQGGADITASHGWAGGKPGRIALPWKDGPSPGGSLSLTQDGPGKPWVTLQSLAAVPLTAAWSSGYRIQRSIAMVDQKQSGTLSRGDIMRITLEVDAQADMTQVALTDPVPAGATVLGSGLGRDSAIAATAGAQRPQDAARLAYEERSFDSVRAYYSYVPKGVFSYSYTVRLNNPGVFQLPPSRVEAMYAPDMHGLAPNAAVEVK
nr:MG2 domain-containing protein [uncultured Noviherbaspirillum sp.]